MTASLYRRHGQRRSSGKHDLVKSRRGKSFAQRTAKGRIKEMDTVKRALPADRRKKAKRKMKSGYGDKRRSVIFPTPQV
jgi:hypothetical protein